MEPLCGRRGAQVGAGGGVWRQCLLRRKPLAAALAGVRDARSRGCCVLAGRVAWVGPGFPGPEEWASHGLQGPGCGREADVENPSAST